MRKEETERGTATGASSRPPELNKIDPEGVKGGFKESGAAGW